jgi:hypothetical protein
LSLLVNAQHGWVYWPVLVVAVAAAAWSYRRVPPSIGRRLRAGLAALRAGALALLVLALMEPVLAITRTLNERPVVAVLLDASRSMAVADGAGGVSRSDEALAALNGVVLPRLARDADLAVYTFSAGITEVPVSGGAVEAVPPPDGGVTDTGAALAALRDELTGRNLAAVVLATDGANNRGVSPTEAALALGVPVFTVGVGSTEPKVDVAIREAVTNRISYVGEALPVEARIVGHGFGDAQTVVTISESGKALDSRTVSLSASGEEAVVTFRVVPRTPGVHRYTVSVPDAPGELTTANNARIVATNALTAKIRILLVGARPSWDYAFMRRELEGDRNAAVTPFVRTGGAVGEGAGLPRALNDLLAYDLVVLVEPDWAAPVVRADWLAAFVRERGGGVLVVGLPESSGGPSADLLSVLPLGGRPEPGAPVEARAVLTELGEASPTMRVVQDRFENSGVWRSLPPVWAQPSPSWAPRADADVLAEAAATDGPGVPLVVVRRSGAGHAMAVPAEGLWRWKMAGPTGVDAYARFVASAVRWLTARGDLEPLSVLTDRDVYAAGEPVAFSAQVYGDELRPTTDASVSVSISTGPGAAPVATLALEPDGDVYRSATAALAPGSYVFEGVAVRGGEEVGRARGEFAVETYSLEDAEVRRRPALLMEIADATGGAYVSPETIESFPEGVELKPIEAERVKEFEMWDSPWLLVGFLGLLSTEWAVRRMKGLA